MTVRLIGLFLLHFLAGLSGKKFSGGVVDTLSTFITAPGPFHFGDNWHDAFLCFLAGGTVSLYRSIYVSGIPLSGNVNSVMYVTPRDVNVPNKVRQP
ncbi:MAG: hypothetical protein U0930_00800 [Pirellulales bacterium]